MYLTSEEYDHIVGSSADPTDLAVAYKVSNEVIMGIQKNIITESDLAVLTVAEMETKIKNWRQKRKAAAKQNTERLRQIMLANLRPRKLAKMRPQNRTKTLIQQLHGPRA